MWRSALEETFNLPILSFVVWIIGIQMVEKSYKCIRYMTRTLQADIAPAGCCSSWHAKRKKSAEFMVPMAYNSGNLTALQADITPARCRSPGLWNMHRRQKLGLRVLRHSGSDTVPAGSCFPLESSSSRVGRSGAWRSLGRAWSVGQDHDGLGSSSLLRFGSWSSSSLRDGYYDTGTWAHSPEAAGSWVPNDAVAYHHMRRS